MKSVFKFIFCFTFICVILSCNNLSENFNKNDFIIDLNPIIKQISSKAVNARGVTENDDDFFNAKFFVKFSSIKLASLNQKFEIDYKGDSSLKINLGQVPFGSKFDLTLNLKIVAFDVAGEEITTYYRGTVPEIDISSDVVNVVLKVNESTKEDFEGSTNLPSGGGNIKDDAGNSVLDYTEVHDGLQLKINWPKQIEFKKSNGETVKLDAEVLKLGFIEESASRNKYLPTVELKKSVTAGDNNTTLYTYPFIGQGGKYKVTFEFQAAENNEKELNYASLLFREREIEISNDYAGIGYIYTKNVNVTSIYESDYAFNLSFAYDSNITNYEEIVSKSNNSYASVIVRPLKDNVKGDVTKVWDFMSWNSYKPKKDFSEVETGFDFMDFVTEIRNDKGEITETKTIEDQFPEWRAEHANELLQKDGYVYFQIDYSINFEYNGFDYSLPVIVSDTSTTDFRNKIVFVNHIEDDVNVFYLERDV